MTNERKSSNSNQADRISEFYTDDTVADLNATLVERGIGLDQIVSVLAVPGQGMVQPRSPRFRVLYRSH